ncbi:hypothetical protein WMF18_40415 [Sorangium sp. So ce315]|uniref:hypothetical protein n=1 Tax=Sorangium sp. So ce315 TaxID=3133299 RepID=UPI003F632AB9
MIHKALHISPLLTALALTACVASVDEASNEAINDEGSTEEATEEAALALSDVTLTPGQHTTFPTWIWWGWTTVQITNYDAAWGCVSLKVGAAPEEYLCTGPGTSWSVARQWAGLQLVVRNIGNVPLRVEVW